MQVDRKPSRWPFVGALIGLLIICLSLPRYWQSCHKREEAPSTLAQCPADDEAAQWTPAAITERPTIDPFAGRTTDVLGQIVTIDPSVPAGVMPSQANGNVYTLLPSLYPTPSIEELIATLGHGLGTSRTDAHEGDLPYGTPTTYTLVPYARVAPQETVYGRPVLQPLVASPEVVEAARAFGEWWVTEAPRNPGNWFEQAARLYQEWTSAKTIAVGDSLPPTNEATTNQPLTGSADSLQITSPNDRLAMLPPQANIGPIGQEDPPAATVSQPSVGAQQNNGDWSEPTTLLNQLARLAQHPYTAHWASDTIWELETMGTRDHASAYDVTTGLNNLTSEAEKAFELATNTQDDQLRAELLRAHWGLARRLDCWKLMHEIHIASRTNGRLAARGALKSIFADPPFMVIGPESQPINAAIESYEQTCDPQTGRELVAAQQELRASAEPLDQELADAVEQHYRNANIRIAITSAMLNRYVSRERSESRAVRERIAGTPVRGHAETTSESRMKLLPATGQWQMNLEAAGVVDSETLADGGAAQIRSRGETDFTASKSITVGTDGVHMEPTSVRANSNSRPMGVSSDYDWMPVVGDVIRNRAMDQYRAKRGQAKSEVEYKVAARAMKKLDRESGRMIEDVRDQMHAQVYAPLEEAGVNLTTVELTSSPERLVARLRVAGNKQIGAHTPRPRAPADSLASLQIHESALTNAAVSLGLDNQRFTAEQLQVKLRERLPRLAMATAPESRPGTLFHFADQDAVQFHMNKGRLELTLALAAYEQEGRSIGPLVVHAFYVPVVDGLKAEFARDGGLGIEGRLSSGDRAVLHNVFKEVFSEERRLPVVKLDNPDDQRLAGLMITQLVMEDGWLGIAVGPTTSGRVAERSRSLR